MTNNVIQSSFSCGEVAPSLYGRVDLTKYHTALGLMSNFFVDVRGGASTRPGTEFIARVQNSALPVRVIPFEFSTSQTYVLEFGNAYVRFYTGGEQVLENGLAITNITRANPAVMTVPGNNYNNGDTVLIAQVVGMTQLNGRSFLVAGKSGNTFQLENLNGDPIDSTAYTAYASGGVVARVYTLPTPYNANDLALLKYSQSADVMTLTHQKYPPLNLSRFADANWTLTPITFAANIAAPVITAITPNDPGGTTQYSYAVTAVSATTGEESLPSTFATVTNSQAMSQTLSATVTVVWNAVPNTQMYNVYRQLEVINGHPADSAVYGFVGNAIAAQGDTTEHQFIDQNISPNFTQSFPQNLNPFANGNNPTCSCYFQQRQCFAGSVNDPQTLWMSQAGAFTNMNVSVLSEPSDAITGTLTAQEVNAIQWLIPFSSLVALTNAGAWQITGNGQDSAITPTTLRALPQAYNGSSMQCRPITINYDILYVPYLGAGVYDLTYNYVLQSFFGDDISVLSSHLFYNYQIEDWTYQETPLKIVWMVRGDGTLLSLTYMKTQDLQGYAQHHTQGFFRSVCSVVEGNANVVYAVVERLTPGGGFVKYIERFQNRIYANSDPAIAWCVDAGLQYPLTYLGGTLAPNDTSAAPITKAGSLITFVASEAVFTLGNVGNAIRAVQGKAIITQFVNSTVVIGQVIVPFRDNYTFAAGAWSCTVPVTQLSGLDHLNGLTVTGLADGEVIAPVECLNGTVTLEHAATDIIIGLPYTCQMQTLPLDVGEPTVQGKRKKISAVTVRQVQSRGLSIGNSFNTLTEIKQRSPSVQAGSAIPLFTRDERIVVDPLWQEPGIVCIEQAYPLPATITAIIPEITMGDN